MKKILAALLVLALGMPALADVAITATDAGNQQLLVSFNSTTANAVRGVALTLNVTGGTVTSAANFLASDFNTFIDYAFTTGAGYTIGMTGQHPFALETAPGVAAFPINAGTPFAVSVGYLDQGGTKLGLTSGTVVKIQLDGVTAGGAIVTIAANATRGGAAVGDTLGNVTVQPQVMIAPPVTNCTVSKPTIAKTTAAPAVAGKVNGGRAETFVASATSSLGHGLEYQFTWGDGNVGAWGADTQSYTYTYAAAATYNVTVQARCTTDGALSVASDALVEATEPVKSTASIYADWAKFSRPNCWAYPKNCRGDADGLRQGNVALGFWPVGTNDLAILTSAWQVKEPTKGPGIATIPNGICADFVRDQQGNVALGFWRVGTNDLAIIVANWQIKDPTKGPGISDCSGTGHYYYFTAP